MADEKKMNITKMLDDMEGKFREGLLLVQQMRHWTEEGYEKGVETMCDVLDLDYTEYVRSAIEEGLWATKKKED